MVVPPFKSDIFYAVQNEDYQTELAILQQIGKRAGQRILLVASSGENALSLLTQTSVARVDAVDINLAQLHLCELRRTAAEHLTRDEQLRLLGCDPTTVGAAGAADRQALFERICSFLPEPSRAYWEANRDNEIAFGVHHVGRNDTAMHDLQAGVEQAGFAPLQRPVQASDLSAWVAVYRATMNAPYIRDLFGLPSEALAARIAGMAGYLGECHFHALLQPHAEYNPFVTTVFANSYATAAGEHGLPLYLQQQGQEALRRLGTQDRLYLHHGNLVEQIAVLADAAGGFDLISISNIADWMTEEQFGALTALARSCLAPGGAFLARTATDRTMIRDIMGQHLRADPALDRALPEVERGPWFRIVAVGFNR